VIGEDYVARLRSLYKNRVPGGADLVTYWFEKARAQIQAGLARLAGLVATNSIRGGANRKVLERIRESGDIFNAWSDAPWINEGAAVRVSLIGFAPREHRCPVFLDGQPVQAVYSDLTPETLVAKTDLTQALRLQENANLSFMGITKSGPFDIPGSLAREWLTDCNPDGSSNTDVLFPSVNGRDLAQRPSGDWIISFGT
jgi:type II restriction/modification system DNA methylase subunit YeeA